MRATVAAFAEPAQIFNKFGTFGFDENSASYTLPVLRICAIIISIDKGVLLTSVARSLDWVSKAGEALVAWKPD